MYEICALLAPKKTAKVRKPRAQLHKSCRVGAHAMLGGKEVVIVERDPKYKSAWFVEVDGVRHQFSLANYQLEVI